MLIEINGESVAFALEQTQRIVKRRNRAGVRVPRLLHGEGAVTWPLLLEAGRREHATRSGLEDTLYLPGGELAPDNAALVSAAHRLLAGSAEAQR